MTGGHPALRVERLTSATRWRLTFLLVQGGSSVALFSVLSHLLSRSAFAATAVAQGVIVIAQSIGDFGLSQAAVAVLPARFTADRGSEAALLAGAATAYLAAAAFGFALTIAAVPIVAGAAAIPVAVSGFASAAAVVVSGADGILRSQGEFRRPLLLMSACELTGFVGVPVAALTSSAIWTSSAVAGGMAVGALGSVKLLLGLRRASATPAVRPFVAASVPLGIAQLFGALATRADTLVAGLVSGLVAAGTFEGSWRVYQLGQYLAGGVASAAAPFVAAAIGAGQPRESLRMIRALSLRLAAIGTGGGVILLALRGPIATLFSGTLGPGVARALPALAIVTPVQAISLAAYYTMIGRDGPRRAVVGTIAAGAMVNLGLAIPLGRAHGATGVAIACALGQATTAVALLVLWAPFLRRLNREARREPISARPTGDSAPR